LAVSNPPVGGVPAQNLSKHNLASYKNAFRQKKRKKK